MQTILKEIVLTNIIDNNGEYEEYNLNNSYKPYFKKNITDHDASYMTHRLQQIINDIVIQNTNDNSIELMNKYIELIDGHKKYNDFIKLINDIERSCFGFSELRYTI
jgi:hypothetical protein